MKLMLDGPNPSLDDLKKFYGSMVKNSSTDAEKTFQKDEISQNIQRGETHGQR